VDRGWHRTAAMGVFGAAAAAGKRLRLTPEQMLAASGIAYSHAASNWQCILDGALTKRMQAGQAASAGVFSATLAQTGFTGARNIFGGRLDAALAAIGRLETLRDARELMAPFTG
jgi:2-methylcitrate dehydratase PrpD